MQIDSSNDQSILSFLNLSQKQAEKLLISQDQRYIMWKHNQLIQKMPCQLRPNQSEMQKYTLPIINSLILTHALNHQKIKSVFPSMFNNFNEKAYNYQKENILNSNKQRFPHKIQQVQNIPIQDNLIQKRENQIQNQSKDGLKLQQKPFQSSLYQNQLKKTNRFNEKRFSPFIPPSKNFTDLNSNSKSNFISQNFIQPSPNSYNMLFLAQQKKVQAFSTDFCYPNTIMKGNINNPFKNTFQQNVERQNTIDIQSVMKYTLGDSEQIKKKSFYREGSLNKKQNPFLVIPEKYIKKQN